VYTTVDDFAVAAFLLHATASRMEAPLMAHRIVVVDDDLATLDYVEMLLTAENYAVTRCDDHGAAAACVRAEDPPLVVLYLMAGQVAAGWDSFV
jgi:CheY-like chemotaxis protein